MTKDISLKYTWNKNVITWGSEKSKNRNFLNFCLPDSTILSFKLININDKQILKLSGSTSDGNLFEFLDNGNITIKHKEIETVHTTSIPVPKQEIFTRLHFKDVCIN